MESNSLTQESKFQPRPPNGIDGEFCACDDRADSVGPGKLAAIRTTDAVLRGMSFVAR
jgi:hypothetical protein